MLRQIIGTQEDTYSKLAQYQLTYLPNVSLNSEQIIHTHGLWVTWLNAV